MNPEPQNLPDDFQKAWQSQAAQPRVTIDESLLRKEVQRNQRDFGATILRRDTIEVGVGVLMVPLWLYLGHAHSLPWTWYLSIPSLLWMAGFFLVDRRRHPQSPSDPSEPLIACAKNSLRQVEHQIWLLRNVFWWYLLPPSISIVAFFAQVSWQVLLRAARSWLDVIGIIGVFAFAGGVLCGTYWFLYYLNQRAVRTQLQPRREELLALLTNLGDESVAEHIATSEAESEASARKLRRWMTVVALCAAALIALALVTGIFESPILSVPADATPKQGGARNVYPKLAPYAAIRWEGEQPIVEIDDAWFKLLSIDDLPVADILAHSRRTYGNLWQKRFEEDLVELLASMGHEPNSTVRLTVQPLEPADAPQQALENVPMTRANRAAIYRASNGP